MVGTCTSETRCKLVAGILEGIPRSDAEAVPLGSPCVNHQPGCQACAGCVAAIACILQVFNAIQIVPGGQAVEAKVKAKSETALYFLRSLAKYVGKGYGLISDWEREGATDTHPVAHALMSGAQFLYLMEQKRTQDFHDYSPTREAIVSQVIIRAKVRGRRKPVYLMQYDGDAQRYQLIGGRQRAEESDAAAVMRREIGEELPLNHLRYGKDYELRALPCDITLTELSQSYGAFTRYKFTLFQIKIHRKQLVLGPGDKWVTHSELMAGTTKEGIAIILPGGTNYYQKIEDLLPGGLEGLPLSLEATQRRPLREIAKDNKLNILMLLLAVLGIVITIYFGLWPAKSPPAP